MLQQTITLLKKDLLLEWRQKHSFYSLILYIAATVFVMYLSLEDMPQAQIWNSLFWVIQLFICVNAVAKSFLQDSRGRMLYYYSIASPVAYIIGKLIFNMMLMMIMSLLTLALFFIFLSNPLENAGMFIGIVLIGGAGISMVFTLMSAIAAKAQQNAALIAILGFPIILPHLMILLRLSKVAFAEVFRSGAVMQLSLLTVSMDVLVLVLSVILFPFLWKD